MIVLLSLSFPVPLRFMPSQDTVTLFLNFLSKMLEVPSNRSRTGSCVIPSETHLFNKDTSLTSTEICQPVDF